MGLTIGVDVGGTKIAVGVVGRGDSRGPGVLDRTLSLSVARKREQRRRRYRRHRMIEFRSGRNSGIPVTSGDQDIPVTE